MADDGVIAAYLRELDSSVAKLSERDDIVSEAEDHLREAAERRMREGRPPAEAEAEAVARFGSAALIARMCVLEAKRGVAVPTNRTRAAGLAALVTPVLLVAGQYINLNVERGFVHGIGVMSLVAAIPAFVYFLWGIRARHGGLGRLGKIAVIGSLVAPCGAFANSRYAFFAAVALFALAVVVLVVEMLRANVLPVTPLVLLATGPIFLVVFTLRVTAGSGDAGDEWMWSMLPMAAGYLWLGWYLWREPAFDSAPRRGPFATA